MTGPPTNCSRAPVAFGRRAVPQLFGELRRPEAEVRLRALVSLCGLMRDPERMYQAVRGGFLEQLKVLFIDEDPSVRTKTCELLHLMTSHSISRQALLSSSLLPALALLMDDSSSSCRSSLLLVLKCLARLPEVPVRRGGGECARRRCFLRWWSSFMTETWQFRPMLPGS
ncbi:radial spoke head 14 homolog [Spinachia spinachia]